MKARSVRAGTFDPVLVLPKRLRTYVMRLCTYHAGYDEQNLRSILLSITPRINIIVLK